MPIIKTLNHDFFAKWTPSMAYVLGFFAADGNMIRNTRGAHFINFKSTDLEILHAFRKAMNSNHSIGISNEGIKNQKPYYSLQLGSKKMFADLKTLGMTPAKSASLQLPTIPKKYVGHFIRGYFDGDGCVYFASLKFKARKNPKWVLQTIFTCGNKDFLAELLTLLSEYGVRGGALRNKTHGYDLLLSHRDSLALYRLMYDTVSATDIYLPRKYKKFRHAIETLYGMRA